MLLSKLDGNHVICHYREDVGQRLAEDNVWIFPGSAETDTW